MLKNHKKWKLWGILLLMMLLAAGFTVQTQVHQVQAATTGFVKQGNNTYYYKDGKMVKGWLKLSGKYYYFNKSTGIMLTGWAKNSTGYRYFLPSNGQMLVGWAVNSAGTVRRYFNSNGYMQTGWLKLNGKYYYMNKKNGTAYMGKFLTNSKGETRYFRKKTGQMATGWMSDTQGRKRYFKKSTGVMCKGFVTSSGNTYYFYKNNGIMATGWVTNKSTGDKYYFDPSTGHMAKGTKTIDGVKYQFASDGKLDTSSDSNSLTTSPTGSRTIKNYLAGALQPVGKALYVWGGGWNDSTRKGISPTWVQWYNSQSSSYDYNNYRDLSTTNRAKGLDCSGFVGWAAYQVMQSKSGVGSGYTVVASDVGSYYKSLGWGGVGSQAYLAATNYRLYPGDVGYNSGHTWIVIGQCSDMSVVIVHSTPQAGCQISGTPTPSGNYSSQAIALAQKYMSRFSGYTKYDYHTSSGNYIKNGSYFRWNSQTLSDPDGYKKMTADQILADLFR